MRNVLHTILADGIRVPTWLLPHVDTVTLRCMRPDILRIKDLSAHATADEIQAAIENKRRHTIQLMEVGYCSNFHWKEKLTEKKQQHQELFIDVKQCWLGDQKVEGSIPPEFSRVFSPLAP